MIRTIYIRFKKALLWQRVFVGIVLALVVYFIISISLYRNWNMDIKNRLQENENLLVKIDRADTLFKKKAELSDSKQELLKSIRKKIVSEKVFLDAVKSFSTRNGVRIDLLDTFTVLKNYKYTVRKRYVMKLKASRFDKIHSLFRYMSRKTIFKILKFEYDNGYLDMEMDVIFSK